MASLNDITVKYVYCISRLGIFSCLMSRRSIIIFHHPLPLLYQDFILVAPVPGVVTHHVTPELQVFPFFLQWLHALPAQAVPGR